MREQSDVRCLWSVCLVTAPLGYKIADETFGDAAKQGSTSGLALLISSAV